MSHVMKRRVTVLASMISVLLIASIAFAAWTSTGSGNGSALAGSAQGVTVEGDAVTTGLLYPNADGDVVVKVTNPNPYAVTVSAINGNGAVTTDAVDCTDSTVTFTDVSGLDQDIAGNNGTYTFTLTDAASMSDLAEDECQGASFSVPVTVVAASAD